MAATLKQTREDAPTVSLLSWLAIVAALVVAYELLRWLVLGAWARRSEARVDRFLREHRIPTDTFRYTHRVAVREMVLSDAGLAAAVAARADEEGVAVQDVQARVRAWLEEIVPQFNMLAYYRVGYALARVAAYSLYHVRLDQDSLRRAQAAIPPDASVVYVSNHRSNADFVVTGFMLSKSVQVSYAVGEWARVWPLESLFRSFGSYFVRRGETDPLYHRTLRAYVELITREGVTQAMFPEGGLSRDGRLRPVKLGLLDSMVLAKADPRFTRPLVFVPVGINFDRVLEDDVLAREHRGEHPFRQRSLGQKLLRLLSVLRRTLIGVPVNTVRFLAKRLKRHGVVAIHFGDPIVFEPMDLPVDRHARWQQLRPFAEELMARIGAAVPVTPVTLCCLAATRIGQSRMKEGVDRGAMLIALRACVDELAAAGAPYAAGDPYARKRRAMAERVPGREDLVGVAMQVGEAEDLRRVLALALDVTARRRILFAQGKGAQARYHSARWDLVTYYANSIMQHAPGARQEATMPA